MPSEAAFYGSLIFGAIGMGAILYGKTIKAPKKMILGCLMVTVSYLVSETWLIWSIGALLSVMLWRSED